MKEKTVGHIAEKSKDTVIIVAPECAVKKMNLATDVMAHSVGKEIISV